MAWTLTTPHNTARTTAAQAAANAKTLQLADAGAGASTLQIYDTQDAGTRKKLATITLASPCGSVHGDVLLLTSGAPEGPVVDLSGEARWARLVTADGIWALDCAVTVDAEGATAGLLIAGTQVGPNGGALLYKGGRLPAVELALR